MLSPEKLLERCNEFRRAGGAQELDKLQPGLKVHAADQCLVARNLNFHCFILPRTQTISSDDPRLRQVGNRLNLNPADPGLGFQHNYELPRDLADSAVAFDNGDYPDELYA